MYRLLWLSLFFAVCALYSVNGLWVLGLVLHCILFFAWLVVSPGESRKPE
ncbi:hypothetical protein OAU50_01380 [Planctomycetota bacterium]|nr:hypothetical protein [Planctomycetota bacterium]